MTRTELMVLAVLVVTVHVVWGEIDTNVEEKEKMRAFEKNAAVHAVQFKLLTGFHDQNDTSLSLKDLHDHAASAPTPPTSAPEISKSDKDNTFHIPVPIIIILVVTLFMVIILLSVLTSYWCGWWYFRRHPGAPRQKPTVQIVSPQTVPSTGRATFSGSQRF